MLTQSVAIQRQNQGVVRVGDALKSLLITGLTAAVLSLGIGLTVLGATAGVLGLTAGGLGAAYGSCQRVEANLAADLGLSAAALRITDPAALTDRVAAQREAGALTTATAERAADRVEAYVGCRALFLNPPAAR